MTTNTIVSGKARSITYINRYAIQNSKYQGIRTKKTNIITFMEHVFPCQEIVNKLINKLNICSFVMANSGTEDMLTEQLKDYKIK